MQVTTMKRVFVTNGTRMPDPDPAMSASQVKDFYAGMYPDLLNAEISTPVEEGDELVYTFKRTTGTKGRKPTKEAVAPFGERLARAVKASAESKSTSPALNPVAVLYRAANQPGEALALPSAAIPLFL